MLEDYYVKPATIDRVRSSWLAPQIESYLEWLQAHGYSRLVVYRRLPLLFHFAEFAQKKGCRDIASCKAHTKEFVSQWLEQHGAHAQNNQRHKSCHFSKAAINEASEEGKNPITVVDGFRLSRLYSTKNLT
jgi:integrase/recombinase XerD